MAEIFGVEHRNRLGFNTACFGLRNVLPLQQRGRGMRTDAPFSYPTPTYIASI